MDKQVFWCTKCDVPVIGHKCGSCNQHLDLELRNPLKPVFKQEYEMYLETIEQSERNRFPRILFRSRNILISDTTAPQAYAQLRVLTGDESYDEQKLELKAIQKKSQRSKYRKDIFPLDDYDYLSKLINANLEHLIEIEKEALKFIKSTISKYEKSMIMSSFSGGKDSTVTSYLVKQIYPKQKIVFSDTGIEYPETISYIKEFGDYFGESVYLEQKNDFYELCTILDPPSRMMRWCCSTQKATPINNYQQQTQQPVLSFDGIRREESALRADYERIKDNTKMIHQMSAYPILDWSELEVWLYILWKEIPYNPLYNEGYSRIGCYPCPNNGTFDNFLMFYFHKELAEKWYKTIHNFATGIQTKSFTSDIAKEKHSELMEDTDDLLEKTKKITNENKSELTEDSEEIWSNYDATWIEDDKWKGRRVKYDNEVVGFISAENEVETEDMEIDESFELFEPCKYDNSVIINLGETLPSNVVEFLKVFGVVKERFIQDSRFIEVESKDLKILYSDNSLKLKISYDPNLDVSKYLKLIIRQINKSLNCFNCGSCIGSCPYGAISTNPSFHIDAEKCTNCLTCTGTKYLKFSCVALHYKSDRKLIRKTSS